MAFPRARADGVRHPALPGLDAVLGPDPAPFALLYRPQATGNDYLELLTGAVSPLTRLSELPVSSAGPGTRRAGQDVLALLPYRQIRERGFRCHDDGEPILTLRVEAYTQVRRAEVLDRLPAGRVELIGGGFNLNDDGYAEIVRHVLAQEIGGGAGSNFVIHRSFTAGVTGRPLAAALATFRRLLLSERGAYWSFVVHTGTRTFVGATPERHVSLTRGTAVMNPISGTFRYPQEGYSLQEVLAFLADQKEADELFMVVDEELKMMARICDQGVRVIGPRLKEMSRVAHTEYFLEGPSSRDVREILRETMFAPTVVGSPLENATRVIARHEPGGRGFYSGVIALIGHDGAGRATLDSAILIRSAELDHAGALRMGVGATLVRRSDPASEVAETHAKAAGLLSAVTDAQPGRGAGPGTAISDGSPASRSGLAATVGHHPLIRAALAKRNRTLSRFWLGHEDHLPPPMLHGMRALLVEAEDTFTGMLAQQIATLGIDVHIRNYADVSAGEPGEYDIVIIGPGPGDPCGTGDPRIAALRALADALLSGSVPIFAVCLGHQVLCALLGLPVRVLPQPNQGTQQRIELFGRSEYVGFYNSFAAFSAVDEFQSPKRFGRIEVSRDPATGTVYGLRGPGFTSVQFHPESVLTQDGHRLLADVLCGLVIPERPVARV